MIFTCLKQWRSGLKSHVLPNSPRGDLPVCVAPAFQNSLWVMNGDSHGTDGRMVTWGIVTCKMPLLNSAVYERLEFMFGALFFNITQNELIMFLYLGPFKFKSTVDHQCQVIKSWKEGFYWKPWNCTLAIRETDECSGWPHPLASFKPQSFAIMLQLVMVCVQNSCHYWWLFLLSSWQYCYYVLEHWDPAVS